MALKKRPTQGMPAAGGRYDNTQLQQLWIANGGSQGPSPTDPGYTIPQVAAAVALAESGGDSTAQNINSNGSVDRGLWQINSVHGAQSTNAINANTHSAISISNNGRSWSPWVTYTTGAYKQFLTGVSAGRTGTTGGGSSKTAPAPGTAPAAPTTASDLSLTDLFTSPASVIGDFVALVGLETVKGLFQGFADYIIRPAWNFNLRAVAYFQKDILFAQKRQPVPIVTTAVFWGFGYALLFTDDEDRSLKGLKPTTVRKSRLGRHVRKVQGLPARQALVKPQNVAEKTAKKPSQVQSKVTVLQTGTMSTTRATPVRVTGDHPSVRRPDNPDGQPEPARSEERIKLAGTIPSNPPKGKRQTQDTADAKSNEKHRTGVSPHPDSRTSTQDDSK